MELYSLGRAMEPATSDGRGRFDDHRISPARDGACCEFDCQKLVTGASFMSIARGIHGSKLTKFAAYGW